MATLRDTMGIINGWLKDIIDLGIAIFVIFVVIDLLFPGTTGVIDNLGSLISSFADHGVAGVIALLLFLVIYKK